MFYYRSAQPFVSGSTPAYEQFATLATAINDRLQNGLADTTQRIHQYLFGLTRQLRNSGDTGINFPPSMEWQSTAQYLDPNTYPLPDSAPAGEPAGANVSNPANAFVFGNEGMGLYAEGDRLSINQVAPGIFEGILLELPADATEKDKWDNQKYNRGGYDPTTGNYTSPAFKAANSGDMYPNNWTFYLKSYGGYQPVPQLYPNWCYDIGGYYLPNKILKLTNKDTAQVIQFNGTCDPLTTQNCGTEVNCVDSVSYIHQSTYYIYVVYYNGTVAVYDKRIWMEGPYDNGGELRRPFGNQITELMISPYLATFRGADIQRSGSCIDIQTIGFDYQHFFSNQYQLAPAYAVTSGTNLVIDYPVINIVGPQPANTIIESNPTHENFVYGGLYITSSLQSSKRLNFTYNTTELGTITLSSGQSEYVNTFGFTPPSFTITLQDEMVAGETISIEMSELLSMKPELKDAYLVVRCTTAQDSLTPDLPDSIGYDYIGARESSDNYKKYGGIINRHGSISVRTDTQYANVNPLWQSSNRLFDKFSKTILQEGLEKYEVTDGKSILHFRRRYPSSGVMIDPWSGLLDKDDPTNNNGIHNTASLSGWSNEWLMHLCLKPFSHSETSVFNETLYGNYFNYVSRAHVLCRDVDDDMFVHFQSTPHSSDGASNPPIEALYGDQLYAPEALSAYTYDRCNLENRNTYTEEQRIAFYKSCQVYPKDYKIEDIKTYDDNGTEMVKVTFTTRFQFHEDAPASISSDINTWDRNNVLGQNYRTDENGIMEWLFYKKQGLIPVPFKAGDISWSADPSNVDNMRGSILPTFYFTKLIPYPVRKEPRNEDGSDPDKTLMTSEEPLQCYLYIRAMCEGFIDGRVPIGCDSTSTTTAYDYTWDNLCYDAFGETWFNFITNTIRPDKPQLGAALPNTTFYAEFMDNLRKCINLLYRARLTAPFKLEARQRKFYGMGYSNEIDWGSVSEENGHWVAYNFQAPAANTLYETTVWQEADILVSVVGHGWTGQINPSNPNSLEVRTDRNVADYKFQLVEPNFVYALPPDIYELFLQPGQNGFFGQLERTDYSRTLITVPTSEESYTKCGFPYWAGTFGYNIITNTPTTMTCVFSGNGTLDAGSTPSVPGDALGNWGLCVGQPDEHETLTSETILTLGIVRTDTMFVQVQRIGLPA